MYSVLYPESKLARFSWMVPETLRTSSQDILGVVMKIRIPLSAIAKKVNDSICGAQRSFQKNCYALDRICRLFAYQFHKTFLGFPESIRMRSVDDSGADSEMLRLCLLALVVPLYCREGEQLGF